MDRSELLAELSTYRLSNNAYEQYIENVKDSFLLEKEEVKRKLYRNIKLSVKYYDDGKKKLYWYGRMRILVVNNHIVRVTNNYRNLKGWIRDDEYYNYLNEQLGL